MREWFSDFENQLDEVRALGDENEYNTERLEERVNSLEDDGVMLNEGVLKACVKEMLTKVKLTVE